jgi:hypothetical protein
MKGAMVILFMVARLGALGSDDDKPKIVTGRWGRQLMYKLALATANLDGCVILVVLLLNVVCILTTLMKTTSSLCWM